MLIDSYWAVNKPKNALELLYLKKGYVETNLGFEKVRENKKICTTPTENRTRKTANKNMTDTDSVYTRATLYPHSHRLLLSD